MEVRKRLSGKLKGNLYKVFVSPNDSKYYSLAKAVENGFKAEWSQDGRKKKRAKVTKKG